MLTQKRMPLFLRDFILFFKTNAQQDFTKLTQDFGKIDTRFCKVGSRLN
jgi:hypothetical protein